MPGIIGSIHVVNPIGLCFLFVVWIGLTRCTHLLVMLARREPLIAWAIGPLGITLMGLHEPSIGYIWLTVITPALTSGLVLYAGLFTSLSPIVLPLSAFFKGVIIALGICLTCGGDLLNALHDLRHPLWGEARILRSMQVLRSTWAKIHFTPFGYSYLTDRFGSNPADLLQAL